MIDFVCVCVYVCVCVCVCVRERQCNSFYVTRCYSNIPFDDVDKIRGMFVDNSNWAIVMLP